MFHDRDWVSAHAQDRRIRARRCTGLRPGRRARTGCRRTDVPRARCGRDGGSAPHGPGRRRRSRRFHPARHGRCRVQPGRGRGPRRGRRQLHPGAQRGEHDRHPAPQPLRVPPVHRPGQRGVRARSRRHRPHPRCRERRRLGVRRRCVRDRHLGRCPGGGQPSLQGDRAHRCQGDDLPARHPQRSGPRRQRGRRAPVDRREVHPRPGAGASRPRHHQRHHGCSRPVLRAGDRGRAPRRVGDERPEDRHQPGRTAAGRGRELRHRRRRPASPVRRARHLGPERHPRQLRNLAVRVALQFRFRDLHDRRAVLAGRLLPGRLDDRRLRGLRGEHGGHQRL